MIKWLRPVKHLSKNNVGVLQKHYQNKNIGDGDLGGGGLKIRSSNLTN